MVQQNMQSEAVDWRSFLEAEALVLSLLGRAFYVYPERGWLQRLADEDVFAGSPLGDAQPDVRAGLELLRTWAQGCRGGMTDEAFDEIRADYTRLFIGPARVVAPPWESVHFNEERLTFQAQTLDVRAWYRRFGLQADKLNHEPDDHIGLEFAFLAHLAQLGAAEENQVELERVLDAQRAFITEHPGRWVPRWCDLVSAEAHTDLYKGFALLARGTLAQVAAALQLNHGGEGKHA